MADKLTRGFPRGVGDREEVASTAAWADKTELQDAEEGGSIVRAKRTDQLGGAFMIGRDASDKIIAVADDRHIVTVAGSRAGKGRSAIIPNLLLWPGSVIVTDPKGENADETARARAARYGQAVHVLDPFLTTNDVPDDYRRGFDALGFVRKSRRHLDAAGIVADALIVQESGGGQHFTMSARNLLHGLILYFAGFGGPRGDLNDVRRVLVGGEDLLDDTLRAMKAVTPPDDVNYEDEDDTLIKAYKTSLFAAFNFVPAAAHAFESKADNERGAVLSTAQEQTAFLSSGAIQQVVARQSEFEMDALIEGDMSLYICLPPSMLHTHSRLMRLVISCLMALIEERSGARRRPPEEQILACLDEFAALGHLSIIESAAGYMAGYGLKLWAVLQDISQLKRHYSQGWETFLGNAGLLQFFGNTDKSTLDYVSAQLGHYAITKRSRSRQHVGMRGSVSESAQDVPLMRPDEVERYFARGSQLQLVMIPGELPIVAERINHDEDDTIKAIRAEGRNYA